MMLVNLNMRPDIFAKNIQDKKPHLFKKAVESHNVDWYLVNELIGRHDHASSNFKILKNGLILKYEYLEQYQEVFTTKYRIIKSKLYELMNSGASLALNKIENCVQTDDIKNTISNFTGRQTIASGYASFGQEPSFGNHWDTHDVFAVQLIGKKRWVIYEPTESSPLYKSSSIGKEHQCNTVPFMDITLEPGDIFYLPRGWWHEVTASGEETFHLAVGTYPPYVTDYMNWLIETISTESELLRLPIGENIEDDDKFKQVAEYLHKSILNPIHRLNFQQWFNGQQRMNSPYAIELFGKPNMTSIPSNSRIGVNAPELRLRHGHELVVNGMKLKLDTLSKKVLREISKNNRITIGCLIKTFPKTPSDTLQKLITEMIKQDILSINIPSTENQ